MAQLSNPANPIEATFQWATRDLTASQDDLMVLFDALFPLVVSNSYEAIAEANRIAANAFRRHKWPWAAYERFIADGRAVEQIPEATVRIANIKDRDVLAERMKLMPLKDLARTEKVDVKGLRKKIEIAERVLTKGPSRTVQEKLLAGRAEMLREAEKRVFDEMGELLVHRINSKIYAGQKDYFSYSPEFTRFLVGLRLSPIDDGNTPRDCIEASRFVRAVDDAFWKNHPVPCDRLYCRCMIIPIVVGDPAAKDFVSSDSTS